MNNTMANVINVKGGYAVEGVDTVYETKAEAVKARDTKDVSPKKVAKKVAKKATKKRSKK